MPDESKLVITNSKLAALAEGLGQLDGIKTKPDEFRPYKFDDENETTWLIADNTEAVAPALKGYQRAKKSLAVQHQIPDGPFQITKENAEQVAAFMTALDALEDREVEVVGLKKISRARLKVGNGEKKNPIPPSVLAKLAVILED